MHLSIYEQNHMRKVECQLEMKSKSYTRIIKQMMLNFDLECDLFLLTYANVSFADIRNL